MLYKLRRYARKLFIIAILIAVWAYFVYYLFSGERNVFSIVEYDKKIEYLDNKLSKLTKQKDNLSRKVSQLRPTSINSSSLEVEAKKNLGYLKEGEYLLILPEKELKGIYSETHTTFQEK